MKGLERADFNIDYHHLERLMSTQGMEEPLRPEIGRKDWHVNWDWVRRWAQETEAKDQARKNSK